jgi:tripartite-type tricarboxylate transporter receptor subunit TctC
MTFFRCVSVACAVARAVVRRSSEALGRRLLLALLGLWCAGALAAESYPSRPVTLIVPVAPGGPVDIAARVVAPELARLLGQPVTVDNRPGASQKIGIQALLRAPRDGYTIATLSPASTTINPVLDPAIGYDPLRDFTLLSQTVGYAMAVVVRLDLPVHSLKDLQRYAREHPGKLTFGSGGNGTALHLAAEELLAKLGVSAVHVPYKSDAPAFNDLLAGQIDMMLAAVAQARPNIDAGRVTGLATSGPARSPQLPQLPTYAESGLPELRDFSYRAWVGFTAAAGIPPAAAKALSVALVAAAHAPKVAASLQEQGYEVLGADPEQFAKAVREEIARNRRVIERSGIRVD